MRPAKTKQESAHKSAPKNGSEILEHQKLDPSAPFFLRPDISFIEALLQATRLPLLLSWRPCRLLSSFGHSGFLHHSCFVIFSNPSVARCHGTSNVDSGLSRT